MYSMYSRFLSSCFLLFLASSLLAQEGQEHRELIQRFLEDNREQLGLQSSDIRDWEITDVMPSQGEHLSVHIRQKRGDIPIYNAVANLTISADKEVLHCAHRLQNNIDARISGSSPALDPSQALQAAARELQLSGLSAIEVEEQGGGKHLLSPSGISLSEIPMQLMYSAGDDEELRLVWDMSIETKNSKYWWSLRLDAQTGKILDKVNWVQSCSFHNSSFGHCHTMHLALEANQEGFNPVPASYRVFPLPVESPAHGNRALVINPSDNLASPFGWHDTNGATGAEFTTTRGNNVHAYDDIADANQPGYSPNGGANLVFDFPLDMSVDPAISLDAAVTNLFYMNNMMHDIWYHYGFTEAAGNFQRNNYGRGGAANDDVRAEAQDGGGTNNANFATPGDGQRPRMQMYLWTGNRPGGVEVITPATLSGNYSGVDGTFSPRINNFLSGELVAALDGTAPLTDICEPIVNGAAVNGKIALIDRGTCNFVLKVEYAQQAGAIAVIMVNNDATAPFAMGGTPTVPITIPAMMVSQADGQALRNALNAGQTVNLILRSGNNVERDGDYDNGIIAHEYGHGISNRLAGGRLASNCLRNDEQMGEGWSDWFGLMLTIRPGDVATTTRGYGTFAAGQTTSGQGIRPAPYTTDMAVNSATYGLTNNANLSQPHGIGYVWASMLWDMSWALIDLHGYDNNLYTGTGGNNIAMRLVMEGLNLQPCSPGFVDGRDAIIAADQLLYNGAHECLLWDIFARRGLGFSASQGSSASRSDQVEAFDLPPLCQAAAAPPTALIANTELQTCTGWVLFNDGSSNTPQQWFWDFGDGNISTTRNPTHRFTNPGVYTVQLRVTNTLGSDSMTVQVAYQNPAAPVVPNSTVQICEGSSAVLSASGSATIRWYNSAGTLLSTNPNYTTPPLTSNTSYSVENAIAPPARIVGPVNNNFGTGGYHTGVFTGTVNFEAQQPLDIVSVWTDSPFDSVRTVTLWNGIDGQGTIVAQVQIRIPAGTSRVDLNISVPAPGIYSLGATGANLYRNDNGAAYPYTAPGLISLTGSSAGPDFYYYFYNWEVRAASCASPQETVLVEVSPANFNSVGTGLSWEFSNTSGIAGVASWDFGDGNTATGNNPSHSYQAPGTYTVRMSLGNCVVEEIIEILPTSLAQQAENAAPYIYPQGQSQAAELILGQAAQEERIFEILSSDGKRIDMGRIQAGQNSARLPQELPSGIYFIRLQGQEQAESLKWIKG